MRIVTVDEKKCRPEKCGHECYKYCPIVKSGKPEIIEIQNKAKIDESLCIGCGICVKMCPFDAISVINLPEAIGTPVHRYGENMFALFGLPIPGASVGILGPNGTGKTTILNIYAGKLLPNLSRGVETWKEVVKEFSGSEIGDYLSRISTGKLKVSYKPQNITGMTKLFSGSVKKLLSKVDERGILVELLTKLGISNLIDRNLKNLSGGELQRVAIAATLARKADLYFFDEPGSYLDIYERLRVSRIIREYTKQVFVVEHDLVMLDYIVDNVHITYGKAGSYGAVSMRKGVRVGINEFLDGFLDAENIRIRSEPLKFSRAVEMGTNPENLTSFTDMNIDLGEFTMKVNEGDISTQEIIGVVGRNALGKTTLMKVLAGQIKPKTGSVSKEVRISSKPQYFEAPDKEVGELFHSISLGKNINLNRDIYSPLSLIHLLDHKASELSGGELQRVAIGICLAQDADLYLLDEPSASLDSEQRLNVAKLIKRLMQNSGKSAIVVEHDLMFLDYLSDKLIVFVGEPGKHGETKGPMNVKEGMNLFLKSVGITLRRDPHSKRPRVNKPDSQKDKEQRAKNMWYENL